MSINRARMLRHNQTEAEKRLWTAIRRQALGHRFRRQHPIGPYVVDFVCLERKFVVEIDGGQHAGSESDAVRDEWLKTNGYDVRRFWNNEVIDNLEGVLLTICSALEGKCE